MEPNPDRDVASPPPPSKPTPLEWTLAATLVDETYRLYLGRGANPDEVELVLQTIRNGLAPTAFIEGVKASEEARLHSTVARPEPKQSVDEPRDQDLTTLLAGLYRGFLGRAAKPAELEFWAAASDVSFVRIAREIRDSEEARLHSTVAPAEMQIPEDEPRDQDLKSLVAGLYRGFLGRVAKPAELDFWAAASGVSFVRIAREIRDSEEARRPSRSTTSLGPRRS